MCEKHEFYFEFDKAFTHQLIEKFEASHAHRLRRTLLRARRAFVRSAEIEKLFMPGTSHIQSCGEG